jgi:hypothetical protein
MSGTLIVYDEVTVKNGFLEFVEASTTAGTKRSSSLPRSFKPASAITCAAVLALASDVSTEASDDGCTEGGLGGSSSSDSDGACSESQPEEDAAVPDSQAQSPKIMLVSLSDELERSKSAPATDKDQALIPISILKAVSTKLNTKARTFEPIAVISQDAKLVITAAHASLAASPKILNVDVFEGALGSTTTIVGSIKKGSLGKRAAQQCLGIVQTALLDAAKHSEDTYVIGYNATPFMQLGWSGFSAQLGSVPATQADATCWDTYQRGYCPRRSTCRWCHPQDKEVIKLVVMLQEV